MPKDRRCSRAAIVAIVVSTGLTCAPLHAGQADLASAVDSTHPIAYYTLDSTSGKSEVGSTTYKSQGGVSTASGGAPAGTSQYAKFDGKSGMIVTTQAGGVTTAASIMAWVNLAELPSKANRILYVAGESQVGNDLDLQFETDNVLRFFTAGGGRLGYAPPQASLVNHWHMIVVTLDTVSKARVVYWDGKLAAKDAGGGQAGKTAVFSIGASTYFGGRWFQGGIQDVALWNRVLRAPDVAAIYAAGESSGGGSSTASAGSSAAGTPTTGPFATTAKVEAEDANGPIQLKREEQIALMFMSAMEQIEHDCQLNAKRACTMNELMTGTGGEHLKFDPNKSDPDYTYTLVSGGMAWEAHANAKKPGLLGFCFMARNVGTTVTTYNRTGKAGWVDTEIMGRGIEGDSFETQ
ncbi:MAG: LamG domain-containing protein [Terracidiphilus sp.]